MLLSLLFSKGQQERRIEKKKKKKGEGYSFSIGNCGGVRMFCVQFVTLLPNYKGPFAFLSLPLLGGKVLQVEAKGSWKNLYCDGKAPRVSASSEYRSEGLERVAYSNERDIGPTTSHMISRERTSNYGFRKVKKVSLLCKGYKIPVYHSLTRQS